jgi:hypothetical protein
MKFSPTNRARKPTEKVIPRAPPVLLRQVVYDIYHRTQKSTTRARRTLILSNRISRRTEAQAVERAAGARNFV